MSADLFGSLIIPARLRGAETAHHREAIQVPRGVAARRQRYGDRREDHSEERRQADELEQQIGELRKVLTYLNLNNLAAYPDTFRQAKAAFSKVQKNVMRRGNLK